MPKAQKAATETDLTEEYTPTDPQLSDEPILYDSRLGQKIPWSIDEQYRVSHTLKPLPNERYFQFQEEGEAMQEKFTKPTTAIYGPKHRLWLDIVESCEGWKPRDDWKEEMHEEDCIAAINALLHVEVLDPLETEKEGDGLLDFDALTPVIFRTMQAGALLSLSLSFRRATKAEKDEALSIDANEPNPNSLASAAHISQAEKLYRLGKKLLKDREGYAEGSDIPPWHLATCVQSFFVRQQLRMGKSLRR